MNSRERILAALSLSGPDCIPFADWIDAPVKKKLIRAMGEQDLDDDEFARRLGMDVLCFSSDFCKPEKVFAMAEAKNKYGKYPINLK